jgi:hypothetical protein
MHLATSWKLPKTNASKENSKVLWTVDSTSSFKTAENLWTEKTTTTALLILDIFMKTFFYTSSTSNPSLHASLW